MLVILELVCEMWLILEVCKICSIFVLLRATKVTATLPVCKIRKNRT